MLGAQAHSIPLGASEAIHAARLRHLRCCCVLACEGIYLSCHRLRAPVEVAVDRCFSFFVHVAVWDSEAWRRICAALRRSCCSIASRRAVIAHFVSGAMRKPRRSFVIVCGAHARDLVSWVSVSPVANIRARRRSTRSTRFCMGDLIAWFFWSRKRRQWVQPTRYVLPRSRGFCYVVRSYTRVLRLLRMPKRV